MDRQSLGGSNKMEEQESVTTTGHRFRINSTVIRSRVRNHKKPSDIQSKFYSTKYAKLSSFVAVISGSLSSVSLISIFLPPLLGRLIYIPWALLFIFLSRGFIVSICRWFYKMIMKFFYQVFGIWNRFRGCGLMEQPRLPV
ncbi:hypothetical protein Dsin_026388 [Dipteronia sinensis]|uniref:Uncharacterized protein n=1 Tax=Dipteronia sinensis TaxID=43782 RepID=A0AAE0DXZ4_9ROSI|nr:hypothetical protein Dsin_026388 [Dipteronia sinensis]